MLNKMNLSFSEFNENILLVQININKIIKYTKIKKNIKHVN